MNKATELLQDIDEIKIICAWCKKPLGEKPPLNKDDISHGICPQCSAKLVPKRSGSFGRL